MKIFDYKTERSKDTILINTKNWLKNDSNKIQEYRMSGRTVINGLTEVLDVNAVNPNLSGYLNPGDKVLISKIAAQISDYYAYSINGKKQYHSIPIMQVLCVFKSGEVSLDSMEMLFDKVLVRKTTPKYHEYFELPEDNATLGIVEKIGTKKFDKNWNAKDLEVKVGDTVLIRDNVSTPIFIEGVEYLAVEENMIVGVFEGSNNLHVDKLRIINNYIFMQPYVFKNLLNSNMLLAPNINYSDLDYSDIYNPDLFIVLDKDESLTIVDKYDIVVVDRNLTNYVYFDNCRFYVINDETAIEAIWCS